LIAHSNQAWLNRLDRLKQRKLAPNLELLLHHQVVRSLSSLSVHHPKRIFESQFLLQFTHLSRREVEAMLGITLQQTQVYQEAKEEEW
jgi:hypothetical protein